ncbi:MAG TPA: hypothetical protein VJB37_01500 [Patescibacteria group bacterium]|nr:hypothetical protein [Patescibacteria group bacterium]
MDLVSAAKTYAQEEIAKFGTPLPVHFTLSEEKAIVLAQSLGADLEIVKVGVYLMDLKLGQALAEQRLAEHVEMSRTAAAEFLQSFDLPIDREQKILNCVEAHHGQVPYLCPEAEICANADCYRFLHPRGFFAYIPLLAGRGVTEEEILRQLEYKIDEKKAILSLPECRQELLSYYKIYKKLIEAARS